MGSLGLARYYSSVTLLYAATLLFGFYLFYPSVFDNTVRSQAAIDASEQTLALTLPQEIVAGKPIRLEISSLKIDLPVDEGHYNPDDGSWTLASKRAQFAMPSPLANDYSGSTLIYGHNNRFVFGPLSKLAPGDEVLVHTDNNLIFRYVFRTYEEVQPNDVSIFDYNGLPELTLQTCSGNWYELRRLYRFSFVEVGP